MKFALRAVLLTSLVLAPGAALAQKPVSQSLVVTETFSIVAIDSTSRVVTLKDKNNELHEVVCGPEVQRFDALKVGDKVTMRYHESLVSAIRAPGAAAKPSVAGGVTRVPGDKPGGTVAQQVTATVTLVALDPKVPSVTVKTSDGRQVSFKVEDKKTLEGYKPGDVVEITYTQALAITVTPAK